MSKNKKTFYGWYLCIASLIMLIGGTGIVNNSASQFMKPVTTALGISRSQFSLYMSFMTISLMAVSPFIGRIYKKFNPRRITILGGLLMIGSWASLSTVRTLPHLYLTGFILGLGLTFVSLVTVNILMTNWFYEKKGLAMGIALTGSGIGSMIFNPTASYLIMTYGYQSAYKILALISFIFILPMFILYRYNPQEIGLMPYGMSSGEGKAHTNACVIEGQMYKEVVRTPRFWAICFISFGLSASAMGLYTHTMPYLTDIGYDQMSAAKILSIMGLCLAFGKLFFGWFNDRFGFKVNFTFCMSVAILSVISLYFAKIPAAAYLSTVLFGATLAAPFIVAPLMTSSVFGQKDFVNIYGTVTFFLFMGPTLAPPLTGYIFDRFGNYDLAFLIYFSLLIAVMIVGQIVLRPSERDLQELEKVS